MSKHGRPYCRIEIITPEKALKWLQTQAKNRPLKEAKVLKLVTIIMTGLWRLNGETIKFNSDGQLEDGQHRLQAIVRTGVRVESFVVYGLPKYVTRDGQEDAIDVFDTIDRNTVRTNSDILARHEVANYIPASVAAAWVWRYEQRLISGGRSSNPDGSEIKAIYDRCKSLNASITRCLKAKSIMSCGLAAALHYLFSQADQQKADRFFYQLIEAEGLQPNTGVKALHRRLVDNSLSKERMPSHLIAWLTIDAWNADWDGRPVKLLKLPRPEQSFPSIRGYDC